MACWNAHLQIAVKVLGYYNVKNKDDFLLGTILPDTPHLTWEESVGSQLRHDRHFFESSGCDFLIPNLCKFKAVSNEFLNEDLYKGYYVHLLVDKTFIEQTEWFTSDPKRVRAVDNPKYFSEHYKSITIDDFSLSDTALRLLRDNFGYTSFAIVDCVDKINNLKPPVVTEPYITSEAFIESCVYTAIDKCLELAIP